MNRHVLMAVAWIATLTPGCKDDSGTATPTPRPAPAATTGAGTDGNRGHANAVDLGETMVGGLRFRAKQDEPIKPGAEGAFDLVITGGSAKPKAVRFWVGTEKAEGSAKAKADEEGPDTWHAHLEIPDPLPSGSQFWAEVEPHQGEKVVVSFDLK